MAGTSRRTASRGSMAYLRDIIATSSRRRHMARSSVWKRVASDTRDEDVCMGTYVWLNVVFNLWALHTLNNPPFVLGISPPGLWNGGFRTWLRLTIAPHEEHFALSENRLRESIREKR